MNHFQSLEFFVLSLLLTALSSTSWAEPVDENTPIDAERVGFFTARPDFRECIYPLCGGYFVKAVNQSTTVCADGARQFECYVSDIISSSPVADDAIDPFDPTPILLVGKLSQQETETVGPIGVFNAQDVHYAVTPNTALGRFFDVKNLGIACITSPCFSFAQTVLNRVYAREKTLSRLNFDESGASEEDVQRAFERIGEGQALYAAGFNRPYQGFAGIGREFVITQFFLPEETEGEALETGGVWLLSWTRHG